MTSPAEEHARWLGLLTRLAVIILIASLLAIAVRLALYIPHTLLLFSLATLAAYTLDPVVVWLGRTPLRRFRWTASHGFRVTLAYVAVFALVLIGAWAMEGRLMDQAATIRQDYPTYQARLMTVAARTDLFLHAHGIRFSLTDTIRRPPPDVQAAASRLGYGVLPLLQHVASLTGDALVVFIIAVYLSLLAPDMTRRFNAMLPAKARDSMVSWERDVNDVIGRFVRGQVLIALAMGLAAGLGCALLGLQSWLILAIFVAVTAVIPVFGPYVGSIPPILAAMVGPSRIHNPWLAAGVILVYFFVINEIGSNYLYPKLVGDALGMHTVLVLFVLFAGLEIAGIVGALFSAPLAAVATVTAVHIYRAWRDLPGRRIELAPSTRAEGS